MSNSKDVHKNKILEFSPNLISESDTDSQLNGIRALYQFSVFFGKFCAVKRKIKAGKRNSTKLKEDVLPVVDLNLFCKLSHPRHRNLLLTIRMLAVQMMQVKAKQSKLHKALDELPSWATRNYLHDIYK